MAVAVVVGAKVTIDMTLIAINVRLDGDKVASGCRGARNYNLMELGSLGTL